tara:strand:+ start:4084 stop:4773 length:690 start_codon:yes stop_codon:yes gene_type:complete
MIILIGASSGLGKSLIKELISFDDIIATYNNKPIKFKNNTKKKYIETKLDISVEKNIKLFIEKYQNKFERLTFINLATITIDKLIHDIQNKDITKIFKINTYSNIIFSKYLIKKMVKDNFGRFIFLSSTRAINGDVGISLYSMTKQSLSSLSSCLSKEYAKFGITSNVLSLGYFNTSLLRNINEKTKKKLILQIPSKKLGKSNNISKTIKMIIKNDYINNSLIKIDGGL